MSVVVALSLLHFIWQGALIGAIAWVAMKLTRSANARYVIGVASLAMMALAPLVTATYVGRPALQGRRSDVSPSLRVDAGLRTPFVDTNAGLGEQAGLRTARWTIEDVRTLIHVSPQTAQRLFVAWLLGVAFLSLRLFFGWLTARRLTRVGVSEPRLEILSHAERIMGALRIQHAVTVLESALVKVPMTMGWWKPVVLLPAAAMTGLSMEQIDALVAHELAHVRRHDYLVNLAQSAIETLLFYHPMVWLISRAVRHERELCCDDLAIAVCGGDTVTYASALADLESMRVAAPALAANGGSLLARVKRILGHDAAAVSRSRTNWSAGVAIIVTAILLVPVNVAKTRANEKAQVEQGVVGGVKDGVTGGADGGVSGGVLNGVAGGVADGVPAGVNTGGDQQQAAIGQTIRLEVTIAQERGAVSSSVLAQSVNNAKIAWTSAQDQRLRAVSESTRLQKVNIADEATAFNAAKTVPGLATDGLIVGYLVQVAQREAERSRLVSESNYGPHHPKLVEIDSAISSIRIRLMSRLKNLVEAARQNADLATELEKRFKVAYETMLSSALAAGSANVRNPELSKDYSIQEDGTILLPYAGSVRVEGLTLARIQETVKAALAARGQAVSTVLASFERPAPRPASIKPMPPAIDFTRSTTERPTEPVAANAQPPQVSEPATPRTEKDVYESAVGEYLTGSFGQAVESLQAFLRDFPRSSRADEAHYFIGVSQLNTQQYGDAVSAFSWLIANSPSSRFAPDAHYHRAQAHRALGKTSEAVSDLQVILRDFRDSTYAPLAKALLDRIQEVPAPQYFVQGFVKQPGQHQWEPGLTLERALEKAGGVTQDGARNRVKVTRLNPATKQYQEVNLGKDPMAFVIQANDIIEIPKRRM